MMSFLFFVGVTLLLTAQGTLIGLAFGSELTLALSLSLPLAAFVNVLVVFAYTVSGVPLTAFTMLGAHVVATAVAAFYARNRKKSDGELHVSPALSGTEKFVTGCSLVLIAMTAIYAFAHAVMLPTMQYDSATNWTMRSEISYVDQKMAFDPDESRGMAKPQYPFLYHALQVTANQGQKEWNDTAANTILFLLSVCSFLALAVIVKKIRGTTQAMVTIAALLGIPLLSLHLAQGYGDLNVLQYMLLSLVCLAVWNESNDKRIGMLMLSGIFAAACVWTKSEGLFFGFAPWMLLVALIVRKDKAQWKQASTAGLVSIALAAPWPVFAWAKGLSLTPHSSDTLFAIHTEGFSEAFLGLVSRGSFGIAWYVIPACIILILIAARKKLPQIERKELSMLLWGGLVFAQVLFIYLCTPNVRFLLNAESYYRQMMIPAAMLILACSLCMRGLSKRS